MISRLLTSEKKTIFFFYRLFSFSFLIKLKRKKKDILRGIKTFKLLPDKQSIQFDYSTKCDFGKTTLDT